MRQLSYLKVADSIPDSDGPLARSKDRRLPQLFPHVQTHTYTCNISHIHTHILPRWHILPSIMGCHSTDINPVRAASKPSTDRAHGSCFVCCTLYTRSYNNIEGEVGGTCTECVLGCWRLSPSKIRGPDRTNQGTQNEAIPHPTLPRPRPTRRSI